jgi:hypothetical protein
MLASWVLDDRGDIWPEASRNLGLALQTERSARALTDFLVRQMGFIVIREYQGRNELLLDPEIVSPVALTAIFCWGADRRFQPTSWVDVKTPKLARVFTNMLGLHNQVGALVERRTPRPDFELLPTEITRSSFNANLQTTVEICRSDMPVKQKLEMIETIFRGRYLLAARHESGDYHIGEAGGYYTQHYSDFSARSIGQSFRNCADSRYGDWTADQFRLISGEDRPTTASINARILFDGRERTRVFYERLIVPFKSSYGRDTLLIASNGV